MAASVVALHAADKVADRIRTNEAADGLQGAVTALLRHTLTVYGEDEFERRARNLISHVTGIVTAQSGAESAADILAVVYQTIPIAPAKEG